MNRTVKPKIHTCIRQDASGSDKYTLYRILPEDTRRTSINIIGRCRIFFRDFFEKFGFHCICKYRIDPISIMVKPG